MARIYDTIQFLKLADISKPTLIKWQKLGFLPIRRIGNAGYFKESDLSRVPTIKKKMVKRMQNGSKMRKTKKTNFLFTKE